MQFPLNLSTTTLNATRVMLVFVLHWYLAVGIAGGQETDIQAAASETLPGKGLGEFDFFYAGEAKQQNMYIVRDGQINWHYEGPKNQGEISDAVLMTNGNILFAHQYGLTLIDQHKSNLWHYDAPKGCEIHTAQPIGKEHVVMVQSGKPARVLVFNIHKDEPIKSFVVPANLEKGVHGQLRHARLTPAGTYLLAHMDLGKVSEYNIEGKEIFSMNAPAIWSAVPLENGNLLLSGRDRWVREVQRDGKVVWDIRLSELSGFDITQPQIAIRRPNGNTLINNWFNQWSGSVDHSNPPLQAIEVTPEKKVVWALKSWNPPTDLGPSTTIQILGEEGISENVAFGDIE